MDKNNFKNKIQQAIKKFTENDLTTSAIHLFQTLGYNTDRQAPLAHKNFNEFKENYIDPVKNFNEEKALCGEWTYVDLLFQLSKEEILKQSSLFDTKQVDNTIIETYLFFAIELNNKSYTRTALSNMTREVNKLFPMPVMILFKHGKTLTLSVISRRLHKRDASKDVLEKVTQIKDINIEKPHRAHIEILFDLSFDELQRKHAFTNFVELHKAWQKTLDIKELNKVFYQKLFNWYLWTLKEVKFPQMRPASDIIDDKIYQRESLIRLITRLLFVWFMKEKGLINPDLFIESKLKQILKNFQGEKGTETIFYKAILQNLFFATLNKPIDQRKKIDKGFNPKEYGDPLVYRFEDLFKEPDKLLDYFKDIPFLNGGLFDCLDQKKDEENQIEIRLDGFSTKKRKQVHLPDKYFFGEHKNIDLSSDYDDKKKKNITVFGLIDILSHYKFTVEESTPVEEEIALDPELLGKVFENLLASYNPETHITARKQTGSFYTPREIVNYMVDESLIACLKNTIDDEDRLRELFSFSDKDEPNPFNIQETKQLVEAIDNCKILDPACGSGAFPMGALQKLTHILHKLDPENKIWFDMVINNLPQYMQKDARKKLEKEDWNYVRKIGIIQQCIYGIDIQPIAIQIAKLRFFISLLVDQNKKPDKPNLGLEPLPNLDFKLVAANTLISAPKNDAIEAYAKDALKNFEKLTNEYFSAVNERKLQIKEDIKRITKNIVNANQKAINQWIEKIKREKNSLSPARQKKMQKQMDEFQRDLERWNTYPNIYKNESVGFFETKYFFPQVTNGFDVIIGNPPYKILTKNNTEKVLLDYFLENYAAIKKSSSKNLYTLFIECAIALLKKDSQLSFIVPEGLYQTRSYKGCVELMDHNGTTTQIITFSDFVFENAVTGNLIFLYQRTKGLDLTKFHFDRGYKLEEKVENRKIEIEEIEKGTIPLKNVAILFKGMVVKDRKTILSESRNKDVFLLGKNISKWRIDTRLYTDYNDLVIVGGTKKFEKHNHVPRILVRRTGETLCCAFLTKPALTESTLYSVWSINSEYSDLFLLGVLNSKLLNHYNKIKNITNKQGFPQILMTDLESLPIKNTHKTVAPAIELLSNLLLINQGNVFEIVLDALVFNLYFPDHMKERGIDVLKFVKRDIHEVMQGREFEKLSDSEKEEIINQLHQIWTDPDNEVVKRMAQFKEKSPDILKVILES